MRYKLFCLLFLTHFILLSQISITNNAYNTLSNNHIHVTNELNHSSHIAPSDPLLVYSKNNSTVSAYKHTAKHLPIKTSTNLFDYYIASKKKNKTENIAHGIIGEAIKRRPLNNPKKSLQNYSYKSYNIFKISKIDQEKEKISDTINLTSNLISNNSRFFLSEKISSHQFNKRKDEKEKVLAIRMTGFKKPTYNILGIKTQSNTLYEKDYTLFNNKYVSPLSNRAKNYYSYKVVDTTKGKRPAFLLLFQPHKSKKTAKLEGVLYLDIETLAIQKAIIEIKGELNIMITHNFEYFTEEKKWFPFNQEIIIKPRVSKKKVSLFDGEITTQNPNKKNNVGKNEFLISKIDLFEIKLNALEKAPFQQASIEIDNKAANRSEEFWQLYRTNAITKNDLKSFSIVDSIIKSQKTSQRTKASQSFNLGYYPVGFFDFDLTYPIKFNNYEGLRLGIGGLTNSQLSRKFRLEGYLAYGFKDNNFKYGIGGGILLNKKLRSWVNINYYDDLKEVGSYTYLTDRRIYSLFEPRLVNIDFYYKHKTWSTTLQHQISSKILTETQISVSDIDQTSGYQFINHNNLFSSYKTTESTLAIRWSPFSEFVKTPEGFNQIYDGFPKFTIQYTQGFKGLLDSDFKYTKIGVKAAHIINRLNQSSTSFLLEGDIANGDVPLTHLFHAYPNAPTKETIRERFSVAGRRSFETMFFNEFFSDKLATLQIRHKLRPINIANKIKPELIFISRYAIGDIKNTQNHIDVDFKSLKHGYQELGLEINKLFAGFGLSFAYRYGAYHLPKFEDNIAFKFTFYLKL